MRALVNRLADPSAVPPPSGAALRFHEALPGYGPTPLRPLPAIAAELGLREVLLKDESDRLGLPAFKVLGASWAVERALAGSPDTHAVVAASAGNHGRAVARVAGWRGLRCRIFLPERAAESRREAIASEGAEVVTVAGTYEEAVARAAADAEQRGVLLIADVGVSGPASWVIDGYATLFAEVGRQAEVDLILVPVGVGSLAAAAARFAASVGAAVIGVEPVAAACLSASLEAGEPASVDTPGTSMAGLDCAEVSEAAWPSLRSGIGGTIAVSDDEARAAMRELAAAGLSIGDCGAAPLAALRALVADPACKELRARSRIGSSTRVLLVGTEGPTDPQAYERVLAASGAQ